MATRCLWSLGTPTTPRGSRIRVRAGGGWTYDNLPSWHVGYRGNKNQPWVGLSFDDQQTIPNPQWFDNSSNYTAPSSSNWHLYDDEIMVLRVDANNNPAYIYRLARGYSRTDEDFNAQLKAAISRDGQE